MGAEQRRHVRHAVSVPAFLRVADEVGGAFVITILDVSASGMRVASSRALTEGARAVVKYRGAEITGVIRYARGVGRGEFHLGIEAEVVSGAPLGTEGEIDLTLLFPVAGPMRK